MANLFLRTPAALLPVLLWMMYIGSGRRPTMCMVFF